MILGGVYLDILLWQFNGSYIMIVVVYNVGVLCLQCWIGEYGDFCVGEVDLVDWVEFILFSEMWNYVQCVLENIQVYCYCLSGELVDIWLLDDFECGCFGDN